MSESRQMFKAGEARGHAAEKTDQWIDSAKDKASNAAQNAKEGKESAAGFLQQTGEQVKNMAQGAVDGVKNTLGIGDKK